MIKRRFRDTNEFISLLGMGCMRFPTKKEDGKEIIDEEQAFEMIDYAYKSGVNYFDTAYMYHDGKSEEFVGRALKRYERGSLNIATKLPIWMADTPKDMERIFNEQLERLQTDYFDFYLAHALDKNNFKRLKEFGGYEFLSKMKEEGKIRHLGFSFHDSPEVLEQIVTEYDWEFAQIQLNYYDWEFQNAKGQYEVLEKHGLPCIVMEPVRGGALANPCEKSNEIFKAARPDKSVASWAIRYAASMPNVLTVLSGMSSMEQLSDNINTLSDFIPVDEKDAAVIQEALEAYKTKDTLPCTGCRYCMDCPQGIDIPELFAVYNKYAVNKDGKSFSQEYSSLSYAASDCVSCGICASKCPQSIEIPEKIKHIDSIYLEASK